MLIVDQHAAHERIRLESLTKGNHSVNINEKKNDRFKLDAWADGKLRSVQVNPPITLELNPKTIRMMVSFTEELLNFGKYILQIRLSWKIKLFYIKELQLKRTQQNQLYSILCPLLS